jgi:hypothetical protein
LLWRPLCDGQVEVGHLARVQRRRELPVRLTQAVQGFVQERVLKPTLSADGRPPHFLRPRLARLALRTPGIRDLPARLVGLGLWRPHVRTPVARN